MAQDRGRVRLPEGKRIAVAITCDFDAHAVWLGTFRFNTPAVLSRGEFGAAVGAPRLLRLFDKHGIRTTWFIPGHTVDTFPEPCRAVKAAGHEIGHHGYGHINPRSLSLEEERREMEMGMEALSRLGVRPRGYRCPGGDFSPNTLTVLEEFGLEYDSSLHGDDFHPYRIRPILEARPDGPTVFGPPSRVIELPFSWFLDDFPLLEFIPGRLEGVRSAGEIFGQWQDIFDYAVAHEEGACYILTMHPQTIGRAHLIGRLDRLIAHMAESGAWFATMSEICDATVFE